MYKRQSKYIKIDSNVNDKKVGIYEVLYSVNYLDKKATALRTVSVIDKEPPEITLLNGDSVSICTGEKFEEPGYTATDNSDGNVTAVSYTHLFKITFIISFLLFNNFLVNVSLFIYICYGSG